MAEETTNPGAVPQPSEPPPSRMRLDLKSWLGIAVCCMTIVAGTTAFMSAYFWTRAEALGHETVYIEHVGMFKVQQEKARAMEEQVDMVREQLNRQESLMQNTRENLIRLLERNRVKPTPLPPTGRSP